MFGYGLLVSLLVIALIALTIFGECRGNSLTAGRNQK